MSKCRTNEKCRTNGHNNGKCHTWTEMLDKRMSRYRPTPTPRGTRQNGTARNGPRSARPERNGTADPVIIAPATQFWHVMKHVGMPRSATPATQNAAMRRWKRPKVTTFAELTIGTALWSSRKRLRTVANGCGRLRTVADGCECKCNVRRTQLYPHTPRVKREPLLRIREKHHGES